MAADCVLCSRRLLLRDGIPMAMFWTVAGDHDSWAGWAAAMAQAAPSPLVESLLAARSAATGGWALDVGCGTGRAFAPLAKLGFQIVGVDPTRPALSASRTRATAERLPAWPVGATAERLPLRAASIDFVVAIGILFHLGPGELAGALREIRRVLRPGGEGIGQFLDVEDWRRALGRRVPEEQVPNRQALVTCFCSADDVREQLAAAGLQVRSLDMHIHSDERGERREWVVTY